MVSTSEETVAFGEQEAMPEVGSVPVNATPTGKWYQPAVLAAPDGDTVATGGVTSRLRTTPVLFMPAELVAAQP